jgi:protease-4
MRILGKIIVALLASVGFMVIGLIGVFVYLAASGDSIQNEAAKAPPSMILSLDLDAGFSEGHSGPDFSSFGVGQQTTLQDAVIALRRARDDDRVKGIVATISGQSLGLAQIQEIRDALEVFRESDKPAYIYSDTIGESGSATLAYYLATSFDEIWLQPSGGVALTGLAVQQPYLKEFLDNLGLRFNAVQRYEYKTAAENLTNTDISPANKEALDALFGSIFENVVNGLGHARGMTSDEIRALMANGPLLAEEALEGRLVDRLAYRDEFDARVGEEFDDAEKVSIRRYLSFGAPKSTPDAKATVAMIHAVGPIQRGRADDSPFGGSQVVGGDTLAKAIRTAAEDEDVDAILLRIDSPGGSYVASDTVWREVVKAKESGMPIIASMGNTAASGGYFIAMAADHIFAEPGTITGSIGVISSTLVAKDAFDKLDINWVTLIYGENGDMFSITREPTEAEMDRLSRTLDAIYEDFTTKAAVGRDMPINDMRQIAKGRVWSGIDAKRIGLIDELGGLSDAIDHTKVAMGLERDDLVHLVPYPKPKDPLESLLEALESGDLPFGLRSAIEFLIAISHAAEIWISPYLNGPDASVLYAPPLVIR